MNSTYEDRLRSAEAEMKRLEKVVANTNKSMREAKRIARGATTYDDSLKATIEAARIDYELAIVRYELHRAQENLKDLQERYG